jgi:2-hydroxychromene-2-carboxylate isomerase
MAELEFWCEIASTYTYLAAMRIEKLAGAAGVEVRWQPFSLGPIFAAAGWTTSPFEIYADKGRYMWRDVEREAEQLGLAMRRPSVFPRNSILASRVALVGVERGWGPAFVRAALAANFADDRDIASPAVIDDLLAGLGLDGPTVRAEAEGPSHRPALRAATQRAQSMRIFGAPTFMVGDEMFWGNDRLERALAWARGSSASDPAARGPTA